MYQHYFRLTESPFSIAPDPRFLYMGARHREAIAHLLYGVGGAGGLVLLTGEVGTGKTTLCRRLIEQINASCDIAIILNPRLEAEELLETICNEFRIKLPRRKQTLKALVDAINSHLLNINAAGRRAVLIIDEAQNLLPEVLEQVRLLTNLETDTRKLLQIVLIGQPELNELLARPGMRQVAQRVVARYHLTHLTSDEVYGYVCHRLRVAGAPTPLFPSHLMRPLFRATGGVPRLINLVCDRALLGTFVHGKPQVTRPVLRQAVHEVFGSTRPSARQRLAQYLALFAALAGCGAIAAVSLPPFSAALPTLPAAPTTSATASASAATDVRPLPDPPPESPGGTPLVWPRHIGTDATLALGSRGPAVVGLRQVLATLQGGTPSGQPVFDEDLMLRLKLFQLAEGLTPDGIAGAATIARLRQRFGATQAPAPATAP